MEINDIVRNGNKVNDFINTDFVQMGVQDENPIFPYKINHIGKKSSLTFCELPVIKYWAWKSDSSFSFFLLLDNNEDITNKISIFYGSPESESEVELTTHRRVSNSTSYSWQNGELKVFLGSFSKFKKYENSQLVVVGNLDYQDIVILPPLKAF